MSYFLKKGDINSHQLAYFGCSAGAKMKLLAITTFASFLILLSACGSTSKTGVQVSIDDLSGFWKSTVGNKTNILVFAKSDIYALKNGGNHLALFSVTSSRPKTVGVGKWEVTLTNGAINSLGGNTFAGVGSSLRIDEFQKNTSLRLIYTGSGTDFPTVYDRVSSEGQLKTLFDGDAGFVTGAFQIPELVPVSLYGDSDRMGKTTINTLFSNVTGFSDGPSW